MRRLLPFCAGSCNASPLSSLMATEKTPAETFRRDGVNNGDFMMPRVTFVATSCRKLAVIVPSYGNIFSANTERPSLNHKAMFILTSFVLLFCAAPLNTSVIASLRASTLQCICAARYHGKWFTLSWAHHHCLTFLLSSFSCRIVVVLRIIWFLSTKPTKMISMYMPRVSGSFFRSS